MADLKSWTKEVRSKTGKPVVDMKKHKPTDNELNNLCYLSMKYIIGWGMRAADFLAVKMLGGQITTAEALDERFIPALAEYVWDHLMGEPESPTQEELVEACKAMRDQLFTMDDHARNSI